MCPLNCGMVQFDSCQKPFVLMTLLTHKNAQQGDGEGSERKGGVSSVKKCCAHDE